LELERKRWDSVSAESIEKHIYSQSWIVWASDDANTGCHCLSATRVALISLVLAVSLVRTVVLDCVFLLAYR